MRAGVASPLAASPPFRGQRLGQSLTNRCSGFGRRRWLPASGHSHALMACYEIPLLETRLADGIESAEEMAGDLGFPIVMKATRPGLVHKGELGGVQLGLSDESAVHRAYLAIAGSLDEAHPQVALQ